MESYNNGASAVSSVLLGIVAISSTLSLVTTIQGQTLPPNVTWPWTLPPEWTLPPDFSLPTPPPMPPAADAIVEAGELGQIQGTYALTSRGPAHETGGHYYYIYSGIPYAKPESYTGANRFKVKDIII
jgi:hypothetical protein